MNELNQIKDLLARCTFEERRDIFKHLRSEFRIHPIEDELNVQAEVILEAIHKASDLTLRGIRGVIAEAYFQMTIASAITGWKIIPTSGDPPYDCLLSDGNNQVRIQVKMQRLKEHRPMMANQAYRRLPSDKYVVETQRTRGGVDPTTGLSTRPYRFGDFDLLAVSLHPSTGDWSKFLYTVERWLIPSSERTDCLLKFQPVPLQANSDWTGDLKTAIEWFLSKVNKTID